MKAVLGVDLMVIALLYGYCLTVQERYATAGTKRVAAWTQSRSFLSRCAIAYVVWVVFMTGLYLFAHAAA